MIKIKASPMKKQRDGTEFYLDENLIKYVHIVNELNDGEFTICGSCFVDCNYEKVNEKVTCPKCLGDLRYYKSIKIKDALLGNPEICKCGHHTNDHSYEPSDLSDRLDCDKCDCINFESKEKEVVKE